MDVVKYKQLKCSRCGAEWLAYEDIHPRAVACPTCNNWHGLNWNYYDGDHEVGPEYAGDPEYDWDWMNYKGDLGWTDLGDGSRKRVWEGIE